MKTSLIVVLLLSSLALRGQERVLPADFNSDKRNQMMRSYLREQVHAALDRRLQELEALKTLEDIAAYQAVRRETFRKALGPLPERTPLRPRVTGRLKGDGFTVEKVIFESQPGFHVTANLYLPEGSGLHPGILFPCGHSENGKAAEVYQKANILLAQNGFVTLCFDPIGQGERKQLLDGDGRRIYRASSEHAVTGIAPVLLGRNLATYMVWDAVRALDYLASRPEVDPERLGCTGNSGGGNLTSYLMEFDERIAAAAPGCFMTTHRHKNESPGPGDAEQNLFGQIRDGFDHPDFILTRAPKPTLILAATHDFVPIEGTWVAFRQAKRVYTKLGYPERVDLIEADEKHGYSKRLREGAARFFARWLQGRDLEVFEADEVATFSDADLQCTLEGQVLKMEGSRSIVDLNTEFERGLIQSRPKLTRDTIREATGIRPLAGIPQPKVERTGDTRLKLIPETGIVLPAHHLAGGSGEPVLFCHDSGMSTAWEEAKALHAAGHPVLLVDLRDIGETKTINWRYPDADAVIAYMLGRSYLAMRAEDVLVCARFLRKVTGARSVRLIAHGELGPAALHAAALEPELISNLRLVNALDSWHSLVAARDPGKQLPNLIHGVLRHYDLPDLVDSIGEEHVKQVR